MNEDIFRNAAHKDIGGPMKAFWLSLAVWSYASARTARRYGQYDLARLNLRKCREWLECAAND